MRIEALTGVTDDVVAALNRLLPQLSSPAPVDAAALRRILAAEGTTVLVARLDGAIVGALALVVFAAAAPVLLTSRPSRVAAGRLYERMGFRVVDTRVFRLD